MNDRVRKLRTFSVETQPYLSSNRAELVTEFYSNNPMDGVAMPVYRAMAFKYILENKAISIGDGELIVGERRWRAARLAGFKQVPVVLKNISGAEIVETALVENIQREDLNPLEKADAYHRLIKEFGLTQQEAAKRLGQERSTVANFLRLRKLPKPIQADIINNSLTMGHARALLGAGTPAQQKEAWRRIVSQNLSVRAAEALIKKLKDGKQGHSSAKARTSEDVYIEGLADDLSRHLGTRVRIARQGNRGRVEIEFYSNEDLERLIARLKTT